MVEGIRLVKFPKKIRDTTSQKNPTSLIKKLRVFCTAFLTCCTGRLILQLLCSPNGNRNFKKKQITKHRDWVDAPRCILNLAILPSLTRVTAPVGFSGSAVSKYLSTSKSNVGDRPLSRPMPYFLYVSITSELRASFSKVSVNIGIGEESTHCFYLWRSHN